MTIVHSRDAYKALAKVLGLPKNCTSFKLVGNAGEPLMLSFTAFVDSEEFKGLVETFTAFDLVKRQVGIPCQISEPTKPMAY